MHIRRATPEDLPLIRAIEQQSETAAHWGEREYEALFAPDTPRRIALVAGEESSRQIYGFAIARCADDEWEIENMVVMAARRRSGIGEALAGELLQAAAQSAVTSVLLEVRESNAAARRLYEKLGFREVGRRARYYQNPLEDACLLKFSIAVL